MWREALAAALAAGGTISHHHGVGRLRAEALGEELGESGLELLSRIKRAWDPHGLLCPGSPLGPPLGARLRWRRGPGSERSAPTHGWTVDPVSGLAKAPGKMKVAQVERALEAEGRTLALDGPPPDIDVNTFVAHGMRELGDPLSDPVDQRLAGFAATTTAEVELEVRPAPRRATGPDLSALFVGAAGRVGRIDHAWLRAHSRRSPPVRPLPHPSGLDSAPTSAERVAFDAVLRELENDG